MRNITEEFIKLLKRLIDKKLVKNVQSAAFHFAESLLDEDSQSQYVSDLHTILLQLLQPVQPVVQEEHKQVDTQMSISSSSFAMNRTANLKVKIDDELRVSIAQELRSRIEK